MDKNDQCFLKTTNCQNLIQLNIDRGLVYLPNQQIDPKAGNNGQVFKGYIGYNTDKQIECCVKKVSMQSDHRLLFEKVNQELILGRQLSHKNIVKFYESSTSQNNFYIFMEYCNGGSLKQMMCLKQDNQLMKTKIFPEKQAIEIMSQIIDALVYMKQLSFDGKSGVVHRDIKPDNIVFQNNIPKLIDFGMSRFVDRSTVTLLKGSPIYMSPQNLKSEKYDLEKNDVWSVGIILYQLVEGEFPWRSRLKDMQDLVQAQQKIQKNITYSNNTSQMLQNLINNMLKYDENDRYDWDQVINHQVMIPELKTSISNDITEVNRLIINYEQYLKCQPILSTNNLEKYVLDLTLTKLFNYQETITKNPELDQKVKELYISRLLQKRKFHNFERELIMKTKLSQKLVKSLQQMIIENLTDTQNQILIILCKIVISLYKENIKFDQQITIQRLLELAKL
ncbi:unnamed protein product [Paramecium sonneborni]|uniref:Protein kinase domain-containing protein n=1 Tax=Paramecium sonneborni TaxID=65129 RepID=A0A8S1LY62_9CILI|nr:unnamed protein product [Paramecium sonneborni]